VLHSDGPVDTVELVGEPVVVNWRRHALLWMAQLDLEDSRRLWQALRVDWDLDSEPARLLVRAEDGAEVSVIASLPWPPTERPPAMAADARTAWDAIVPAESATGRSVRKSAFVQTGMDTRELLYTLIPFWRESGDITFAPRGVFRDSDVRLAVELALATLSGKTQSLEYQRELTQALWSVRNVWRDEHDSTTFENWVGRLAAGADRSGHGRSVPPAGLPADREENSRLASPPGPDDQPESAGG
jgi:hypothetical protein